MRILLLFTTLLLYSSTGEPCTDILSSLQDPIEQKTLAKKVSQEQNPLENQRRIHE